MPAYSKIGSRHARVEVRLAGIVRSLDSPIDKPYHPHLYIHDYINLESEVTLNFAAFCAKHVQNDSRIWPANSRGRGYILD